MAFPQAGSSIEPYTARYQAYRLRCSSHPQGKTYFGSLVESGAKEELTSHYLVRLNRDIIRLYGESQWTAIDWQQRLKLRRKPLAQALHAYFSSHRNPFPVKLAFLQKITGSRNAQPASLSANAAQLLMSSSA